MRIGDIVVPTLFVWGDRDLAWGKQAAIATAQYMKASYRFKSLAGYSHWLLEEAPDQIAELILSHIKSHPLSHP
jgi:pimeloyl-ACP methyl ester carboxylesterase